MRDKLPDVLRTHETGVINLDTHEGPGTHWVSYYVHPRNFIYFDSYGLAPQREFIQYICNKALWVSTLPVQTAIDPPLFRTEAFAAFIVVANSTSLLNVLHKCTAQRL